MDPIFDSTHGGIAPLRHRVRLLAAGLAAVTALMYALIGAGVLTVVEQAGPDAPSLLTFGLGAGAMFGLGAALLVLFDQRALWAVGAGLQIGVILMYIAVAPQRTPQYEVWGLTIKALQAVLLGALLYLAATPAAHTSSPQARPRSPG